MTDTCNAPLGNMIASGQTSPLVCTKPKGHPEKEGHGFADVKPEPKKRGR